MPRQRHAGAPARPGGRGAHAQPRSSRGGALPSPSAPWENEAEAGHTHDPHEVTVQLDGVGRQLDDLLVRQAKEGQDADGMGAGDGPVFVDETGRRSRRYRRIGIVVGISCAVYAVVIVATLLSGNSDAPWLPVPGQQDEQPAGQVETSPLPSESAEPTDTAEATPGAPEASVSAGVTPSSKGTPAAGAAATPGASPSASKPGTSAEPQPSVSASKPEPGTTTPEPEPEPSVSVSSSPEPSPTESSAPSSEPSPSVSPAGDGGTVAGGPSDPTPIAEGPAEPSATLASGDGYGDGGGDPATSPTSATSPTTTTATA
ncbi:hypothetical protein [Streptomyces sp. NPDC047042]|uniref:hypothetical protein n=1 Tax=Streptomyces sp. NPDC047042 TaxID=3154807 RepID=UPI0033FED7A3